MARTMNKYPRKGEWRGPIPTSGRVCVNCTAVPAGVQFIQVSIFRGDDEHLALCRDCSKKLTAIEMSFLRRKP